MGAIGTADQQYELELETGKKNVFVTQLHQRDEDENQRKFPVVKEHGDKLIETGLRTLQKTLLLKKEVEVEKVDEELAEKREEFRIRMEKCAEKQVDIQRRTQEMRDRVSKFEKFISENEAKRRRAIQKYHNELKLKEQKTAEHANLCGQMEVLKDRHSYLETKLEEYKLYEAYLLKVVDILPEDYLPNSDDKVKGLMMRHRTLEDSNLGLVENLDHMGDQLKENREQLEQLNEEHDRQKVSISSNLARQQKLCEQKHDKNDEQEQRFTSDKWNMRKKRTELGEIYMAIENITEKCRKLTDDPHERLNLDDKLIKIMNYVNEREDVLSMAAPEHDSGRTSSKGSDRDKALFSSLGKSRHLLPPLHET